MSKDFSLLGFVTKLTEIAAEMHEEGEHALKRAALVVQAQAKSEIGAYQEAAGPFAGWAELADSTKEDRVRQGYTENDPLLRTGELRDSIEITVEMHGFDGEAHIGSDSEIAVYQELGTSKMPPRSFLGGALFTKAKEVKDIIGDGVYGALVGREVYEQAVPIIK